MSKISSSVQMPSTLIPMIDLTLIQRPNCTIERRVGRGLCEPVYPSRVRSNHFLDDLLRKYGVISGLGQWSFDSELSVSQTVWEHDDHGIVIAMVQSHGYGVRLLPRAGGR
jgi:hypothetical protein